MKNLFPKESSHLLNTIFKSMNGGLIILDESSIIQYVNPESEKMFGYNEGELEENNLSILIPEHLREDHGKREEKSKISGQNIIMRTGRELLGLRKDGSLFPFEIMLSDYEQDGQHYISAIIKDLTQAKKNEEQLLEAIKNAEAANSAKSDYFSTMSHDIKTPMNGVIGMISLLKLTNLSEEQNEYVELAYTSASKLVSILNNILDLVKKEPDNIDQYSSGGISTSGLQGLGALAITPKHPPGNKTKTESRKNTSQKDIKILLVDDTKTNLRIAKLLLKKMGHDADTAADGMDALQLVEKNTYDLIFMDCRMPEMDGYETTRRIRNLPSNNQNIPIIALTGQIEVWIQDNCIKSGMNDFLAKPLNYDAFRSMIQKWAPPTQEASD